MSALNFFLMPTWRPISDMATNITVGGPDVTIGDAADGTMMVHQGAARSRRCRRPAWYGGARRGGGVGVALAVDAVVGRREDAVDLPERGDGLIEAEAERDEVVDRGLRHGSPSADGDDSEAAREVPLPRVAGGGRRDPGEDGRGGEQQEKCPPRIKPPVCDVASR